MVEQDRRYMQPERACYSYKLEAFHLDGTTCMLPQKLSQAWGRQIRAFPCMLCCPCLSTRSFGGYKHHATFALQLQPGAHTGAAAAVENWTSRMHDQVVSSAGGHLGNSCCPNSWNHIRPSRHSRSPALAGPHSDTPSRRTCSIMAQEVSTLAAVV